MVLERNKRSAYYMAKAKDTSLSRLDRAAAYYESELEEWADAVAQRNFPIASLAVGLELRVRTRLAHRAQEEANDGA